MGTSQFYDFVWVSHAPCLGFFISDLKTKILSKSCKHAQSCPTLCDLTDCSPPGSSVHGILQARILEWVAKASSRGSSWHRDQTQVSTLAGRFFTAEQPAKPFSEPCLDTKLTAPLRHVTSQPIASTRDSPEISSRDAKGIQDRFVTSHWFRLLRDTSRPASCVYASHHQGDRDVNTCSLHPPSAT